MPSLWPEMEKHPLPPDAARLPSVIAEPWLRVGPPTEMAALEGPIFDTRGNLYLCHTIRPENVILKVTPAGEVTEFFRCGGAMPVGLAVHRDGRIFGANMRGSILIITPDGRLEREVPAVYDGETLMSDDLVFDRNGDLYFTDFRGTFLRPEGGLYVMRAEHGYTRIERVTGGLAGANGISFSPDFGTLWIAESARNTVDRFSRGRDGSFTPSNISSGIVYHNPGIPAVDSNKADSAGNLYQAVMFGGRLIVLSSEGIPIGNVLSRGREEGRHMITPNLVIRPGTSEGYMVSSGADGAWLLRFPAIAPAQTLYSHM